MHQALKRVAQVIAESLFPVMCCGCMKDGYIICPDCEERIPIRSFNESWERLRYQQYVDRCSIVSWYEVEVLKQLIHMAKYHNSKDSLAVLGRLLVLFWNKAGMETILPKGSVIVPVPLHRRKQLSRGYNQSVVLARFLASELALLVDESLVVRKKYTKSQVGLHAQKRHQNIANAFSVIRERVPQNVLLIDDVVTTGATLDEIARVLKAAGVQQVFAIVLAKQ